MLGFVSNLLDYLCIGDYWVYRQSKVHPPTTLLRDIYPGVGIQQWSSSPHCVKYAGKSSGFLTDASGPVVQIVTYCIPYR